MRVLVQITSGPAAGRRMAIAPGQTLQVGRTEWADIAIPKDGQMSSVHFSLEADYQGCYVKDLGSTNGTFLNRRRLKPQERAPAPNGAEILAGQSVFLVQIEGAVPDEASATPMRPTQTSERADVRLSRVAPAYVAPAPLAEKRSFTAEKCDSGLTLCKGTVDEIPPGELAVTLCSVLPAHLIVDFRKLGEPRPGELGAPNYLFAWLEPPAAELVSPVVISQDDYLSWPSLMDAGWGNDAVVCLFSRLGKAQLLEHLRQALHKGPGGEKAGGIVGYCWPAVLGPLLSYSRPQFAAQLLAGIEAVLIELTELPDAWQIFGSPQMAKILVQLGFREEPPEG